MSTPYEEELNAALKAVHRASIVTKNVMNGIESVDKSDATPVTMADFAAQALMICAIHEQFPHDRFVAEESADILRADESLLNNVWELVKTANDSTGDFSNQLPTPKDASAMMDIIDLGYKGTPPSSGRVWILDPVDGTATFLKGQQYAVCLSLTIDGRQQVGVIGCPNLAPGERRVEEELTDREGYGVVLSAVIGQGSSISPMSKTGLGAQKLVKRTQIPTSVEDLQFADSIRSSHAHLASHQKVFQSLKVKKNHLNVWSMQIKYVALALGACDALIRIPPDRSVRACVWDHAGGQLIFTESGGKVTDLDGQAFDFAKGRAFGENWGFVAADGKHFDAVYGKVQDVLFQKPT